jgi:DNA-binding transcriptional MerR regulator
MRIGELSSLTGVDTATIRYYEREGLVEAPNRLSSKYRNYGPGAVQRIQFIRHCRLLDMRLADVRRLLTLSHDRSAPCAEVNRVIDLQLERVRIRRRELQTLERQLSGLRAQCGERHRISDCGIVDDLMHAAQEGRCACHRAASRR